MALKLPNLASWPIVYVKHRLVCHSFYARLILVIGGDEPKLAVRFPHAFALPFNAPIRGEAITIDNDFLTNGERPNPAANLIPSHTHVAIKPDLPALVFDNLHA